MGFKKSFLLATGLFFFLCFASPAYGAVPKLVNYQGRLTDENDVLYDGTVVYMKFEIYDAATSGNELWSSDEDNGGGSETCGVTVIPESGVFNVVVGDTSLSYMADIDVDFGTADYYLQLKIQEGAQCPAIEGNYETLTPRQRIVSSGFAFTSRLLSGDSGEYVSSPADDILGFYGLGGADDTDLYLDLDGTYPWLYSNTDTKIGIDDDLEFVGAQSITTSAGALTIQPAAGNNLNISLSTTGDLAVNTNQLYVDTSAGNVGIGTTGPNEKLDVNGNIRLSPTGDSALYFDNGVESLMWDDAAWPAGASIGDQAGFILSDDFALLGNIIKNVASTNLVIDSHGANADLIFQTGGSNKVTLDSTGHLTLNDSVYGYLTYASIARPTGATALNYYDSTENMMMYYDGGISYWRSMQGVSEEIHAPEYPSSVIAADGTDNQGTLVTGVEIDSDDLYTFYQWTTNRPLIGAAELKDYDIYTHLKVPDNFQSWASNAITLNFKTGLTTTANNSVQWWIYEDGNAAALMSSAAMASGVANTWTSDSATNTELGALTAGDSYYIQIKLLADKTTNAAAYAGKIFIYYR